jgi:hypothetical protein
VTAQERARFDFLADKLFDGDLGDDWIVSNRARLGARIQFGGIVTAFVQIQDVRKWGSELNPATGTEGSLLDWVADGLDVHQAWGQIEGSCGGQLRVGRQEIAWHGERLIGAVGWTPQGRSFDAVRLSASRDKFGFDAFWAKLQERPSSATDTALRRQDLHLVALRAGPRLPPALDLDGLLILRLDALNEETLATFGAHVEGKPGPFRYELEGYGQAGARGASSVAAWLVGIRAGVAPEAAGRPYLGGGVDVVSGDPDPSDSTIRAFDTLYATNHKYYGHMDVYLNVPLHTRGEGLVDGIFVSSVQPHRTLTLNADVHVFGSVAPADSAAGFHGVETDLEAAWNPWGPFTLGAGFWGYFPGSFWGSSPQPELGGYVSADFLFK